MSDEVVSEAMVTEVVNHVRGAQKSFFDCSSVLSYIDRLNDCIDLLRANYGTERGKEISQQLDSLISELDQTKIYKAVDIIKNIGISCVIVREETRSNG